MSGTRGEMLRRIALLPVAAGLLAAGCGGKAEEKGEAAGQDGGRAPQTEPVPEGMMRLKLNLPKPKFKGTPTNIRAENLEKPRKAGTPRPTLLVPDDVENVARSQPVSASVSDPFGDVAIVTDGDKEAENFVTLGGEGPVWVQVDLGKTYRIYAVAVWHYHGKGRSYRDVIVQVADDPDFIDVETVFNNDHDNSSGLGTGEDLAYVETNEGKLVDARGVKGRYVRLHSDGFDDQSYHEMNHYTEVEVYGKPPE